MSHDLRTRWWPRSTAVNRAPATPLQDHHVLKLGALPVAVRWSCEVGLLATLLLVGAERASAAVCAFDSAAASFQNLLSAQQLEGGGLLVGDRQGLYLERYFGSYDAQTVVAIASATKWLSAVRILQLRDQGVLDLEAPVSLYLPHFSGEKGTMTLRQMFSHTAGYGDDSFSAVLINPNLSLAQAVDQIACCRPLNSGYAVGAQFSYGGVSMHIGGRVAEVAAGGDWQAQWQHQLGAPLGVTTIDWGASAGSNYGIAGGARSNLRDYGRVLHMLVNEGRGNGRQVLKPGTAALLRVDQVGSLPVAYAPPNVTPPVRYGLGNWLAGSGGQISHSLGAFGYFPWIDAAQARFGVFMVRGGSGFNAAAVPVYFDMLASVDAELAQGCTPIERFDEILLQGFED